MALTLGAAGTSCAYCRERLPMRRKHPSAAAVRTQVLVPVLPAGHTEAVRQCVGRVRACVHVDPTEMGGLVRGGTCIPVLVTRLVTD